MKLLLVGGTGVLSTAVTHEAIKKGIDVYMINRGNRLELIPNNIHLLRTDVRDRKRVASLIDGLYFDAVIDFLCFTERDMEYSFGLFGQKTDQYVFISSCCVYNLSVCQVCEEDSPKIMPIWDYSVNKNKCEELLKHLARAKESHYTIIRPAVTYGNTRIPYGIMPPYGYHWTLVERILNDKPVITWDGGENRCNITHVNDFAIGVVGLLGNKKAYNEAFNIVGDETPAWKDVLNIIGELLEHKVKIFDIPSEFYAKEIPSRKGEILGGRSGSNMIINNKKIKSVVDDFKQTISLRNGLEMTLDYYKNHNYIYGIDYSFDGDTDRIIRKYAKKHNISISHFNLYFIDYLKKGLRADRFDYFVQKNKDNICICGVWLMVLIIKKWGRVCKKLLKLFAPPPPPTQYTQKHNVDFTRNIVSANTMAAA